MMKAISSASLALVLLSASAFAADLPSTKAPPPPPPPPAFSWSGFYVGANFGYTWGAQNVVSSFGAPLIDNDPLFGTASALSATTFLSPTFNGPLGGGQIGYNHQFSGSFVAGVEADIQGAAVRGSLSGARFEPVANQPAFSITTLTQASRSLDYFGTIRGRLGYALRQTVLIYGTAGLAYGGVSQTVSAAQLASWSPGFLLPPLTGPFGASYSQFSDTRVGWTAGGGVEWAFLDDNWSAKLEYLYYDLGRVRSEGWIAFDTNAIPGPGVGGTGVVSVESQTRFTGHTVRAGVNYRFNFVKEPVVAKY